MEAVVTAEDAASVVEGCVKTLRRLREQELPMPTRLAQARSLVEAAEGLMREAECLRDATLAAVDRSGLHGVAGHRSAHTFVAHHSRMSGATAARLRRRTRLALVPEFAAAVESGDVGGDHADRLGRALANTRARDGVVACDRLLTEQARRLHADEFDRFVSDIVRAADPDGTRDRNERAHEGRDFHLHAEFDGTFAARGGWAALQGAELKTILDAFTDAEFETDLVEARERLGADEFGLDELSRTPSQRRADALLAMARAAADSIGADGSKLVTHVLVDHATFERECARLAGGDVTEAEPAAGTIVCRTLGGDRLEPTETVAAALLGHVRRVVMGADGVVIDLGREQRLFRGNARLAALLGSDGCPWPGCRRPPSHCEIDHLTEWHQGGRTDQSNGSPFCRSHNREKHRSRTRVRRRPDGAFSFTLADGTELS